MPFQESKKNGCFRGLQRYKCLDCNHIFNNKRRDQETNIGRKIWQDYIHHKQTVQELCQQHSVSHPTIYSPNSNYISCNRPNLVKKWIFLKLISSPKLVVENFMPFKANNTLNRSIFLGARRTLCLNFKNSSNNAGLTLWISQKFGHKNITIN